MNRPTFVPLPVLEKVRWQEVEPEYDPYKFNSFPINAARQVNRATRALQSALSEARESGRIARMPPVITWQSRRTRRRGTTTCRGSNEPAAASGRNGW